MKVEAARKPSKREELSFLLERWVAILLLIFAIGCDSPNPVNGSYYLIAPYLIAGFNRPTAPGQLQASYDIGTRTILLQWQASTDPDTGFIWNDYRIYYFLTTPPADIYHDRYRLGSTNRTYYSIDSDPFNGTIYFAVTAYDSGSESLPSNIAELSL